MLEQGRMPDVRRCLQIQQGALHFVAYARDIVQQQRRLSLLLGARIGQRGTEHGLPDKEVALRALFDEGAKQMLQIVVPYPSIVKHVLQGTGPRRVDEGRGGHAQEGGALLGGCVDVVQGDGTGVLND